MSLKRASSLTLVPWIYRLWQAPFVSAKLAPVLRHNDLARARRALDVGCGPGNNTPFFAAIDYLGIDIEERYVDAARRKHGRRFVVADARTFQPENEEPFDFILLNSLLHHLDSDDVLLVLRQLERLLAADGHIHVIDLVLPPERGFARWLAVSDRGDFPRRAEQWSDLLTEVFEPEVFEPFAVSWVGIDLWKLIYFKGSRRGSGDGTSGS